MRGNMRGYMRMTRITSTLPYRGGFTGGSCFMSNMMNMMYVICTI